MYEGKEGRKGKINGRKQQMWESNKCFRNTRKQQRIKITFFIYVYSSNTQASTKIL